MVKKSAKSEVTDDKDEAEPQEAAANKPQPKFDYRGALVEHLDLCEQLLEGNVSLGQRAERPDKGKKFHDDGGKMEFRLPPYFIPSRIWEAMLDNNVTCLNLQMLLTRSEYIWKFQTLLWVEEAHQKIVLRRYALEGIKLGDCKEFYSVTVPGLAEGRPSLMQNDKLYLKCSQKKRGGLVFEGYIHEIRGSEVLIKLNEKLHAASLEGRMKFDVSFEVSRTPFRRSHHGVSQFRASYQLRLALFPKAERELKKPLINVKEKDVSKSLCSGRELNQYQKSAVIHALRAVCRPAPYIIFGPPGTGKTMTMVEVILQAYKRKKDAKILVCGNSNACADALAQHINRSGIVPTKEMLRVAAFYRWERNLIPQDIEEISFCMEEIEAKTFAEARIVITTCVQAGSFYQFKDRFDYLFVDEAGHATEPEAIIPMSLLKDEGCCVLAGDPYQLGPVCISHIASESGLGVSLLERLEKRIVYSRKESTSSSSSSAKGNTTKVHDPRYITQLLVCYRCDPRVLSISNEAFYDNLLKCQNKTPQKWMEYLQVEHPLVFHPVKGREKRDNVNPSWYNQAEADACVEYVRRLYENGLKPEQLGIITPYKSQIKEILWLLEEHGLKPCKVNTMESFQGDEREIIIISTVRSRQKNLDFDKKFQLGFLFNPKRFNVAISRAKWMVITVGDPDVLMLDDHWKMYLDRAFRVGRIKANKSSSSQSNACS